MLIFLVIGLILSLLSHAVIGLAVPLFSHAAILLTVFLLFLLPSRLELDLSDRIFPDLLFISVHGHQYLHHLTEHVHTVYLSLCSIFRDHQITHVR